MADRRDSDYRLDEFVLDPANRAIKFDDAEGRRLQGIDVAGAVTDAPYSLTIEGAPTVELTIHDPRKELLNGDLLTGWAWGRNADDRDEAHWMRDGRVIDAQLDDVWLRLVNVEKLDRQSLKLTLEDRLVSMMRAHSGPRKVYRDAGVTRAEFIRQLAVGAGLTDADIYIPELHVEQPIAGAKLPSRVKDSERRRDGRPGIHSKLKLKIEGRDASPEQLRNANIILDTGLGMRASAKVLLAGIVCSINESRLRNIHHGDAAGPDSTGLFQQRDSWGPRSVRQKPEGAAKLFFKAAIKVDRKFPRATVPELITLVQFPGVASPAAAHSFAGGQVVRWEQRWLEEGKAIVRAYSGRIGVSDTAQQVEVNKPYPFARGKGETSWDAAQRLAGDVQWRCFVRWQPQRLWYASEEWLFDQQPQMIVREGESGVDEVTFGIDLGARDLVAELQTSVHFGRYDAMPGMVVAVENEGAADGRWLVHQHEGTLTSSAGTVTHSKPLPSKPEPANETETVEFGGTLPDKVTGGSVKGLTPKQVIDRYVLPIARRDGINVTPASVEAANARHGPTVSGGRSDHQGPPSQAWAADMSNGTAPTKEMDKLARDLGKLFGIAVHFGSAPLSGRIWEGKVAGFKVQIIYRTMAGGNHTNHVHCGLRKL